MVDWILTMKSAAPNPFPATSPMATPKRPPSRRRKSTRSPPTSLADLVKSHTFQPGTNGSDSGFIALWTARPDSSSLWARSLSFNSNTITSRRQKTPTTLYWSITWLPLLLIETSVSARTRPITRRIRRSGVSFNMEFFRIHQPTNAQRQSLIFFWRISRSSCVR